MKCDTCLSTCTQRRPAAGGWLPVPGATITALSATTEPAVLTCSSAHGSRPPGHWSPSVRSGTVNCPPAATCSWSTSRAGMRCTAQSSSPQVLLSTPRPPIYGFVCAHGLSSGTPCTPSTRWRPWAAGLTVHDATSGEHVLQTQRLPDGVLARVTPLVLRWRPAGPWSPVCQDHDAPVMAPHTFGSSDNRRCCTCRGLQLFQTRQLPQVTDGRASAGPVDVAAFLAQPSVQEQVMGRCHNNQPSLPSQTRPAFVEFHHCLDQRSRVSRSAM